MNLKLFPLTVFHCTYYLCILYKREQNVGSFHDGVSFGINIPTREMHEVFNKTELTEGVILGVDKPRNICKGANYQRRVCVTYCIRASNVQVRGVSNLFH